MEELDHQASKALEGSRYAHSWADLDENALGSVNVDLEFAGFVDGRVEESEEALMRDIWTSFTDIATHFPHDSDVFITVQ